MTDDRQDSEPALREAIDRYNGAWNAHDLDAIMALHAPDMFPIVAWEPVR